MQIQLNVRGNVRASVCVCVHETESWLTAKGASGVVFLISALKRWSEYTLDCCNEVFSVLCVCARARVCTQWSQSIISAERSGKGEKKNKRNGMKVSVQRAVGRTRIPRVPSPSSPVSLLFLLSYPALLTPPTLHPPALSLFFLLIFLAIETQNPCNPHEPGLSRGDETRRVWRGGREDAGKVNEEGKKHHILYVFQLNMTPAPGES